MKYLAVFDDDFLSNFRLDDNGLTLVLTDKTNCTRATKLLPIQRPVLTAENGGSVFLTQDHIQALLKFEQDKMLDEMIKDINKQFEELPKSYISKYEFYKERLDGVCVLRKEEDEEEDHDKEGNRESQ